MKFIIPLLLLFLVPASVSAHPGRTDANGGHYDRSTGEYHYHHGYSAHQHEDLDGDGDLDCPYDFKDKTGQNSGSASTTNNINSAASKTWDTLSREFQAAQERSKKQSTTPTTAPTQAATKPATARTTSTGYRLSTTGAKSSDDSVSVETIDTIFFFEILLLPIFLLIAYFHRKHAVETAQYEMKQTHELELNHFKETNENLNAKLSAAQKGLEECQGQKDVLVNTCQQQAETITSLEEDIRGRDSDYIKLFKESQRESANRLRTQADYESLKKEYAAKVPGEVENTINSMQSRINALQDKTEILAADLRQCQQERDAALDSLENIRRSEPVSYWELKRNYNELFSKVVNWQHINTVDTLRLYGVEEENPAIPDDVILDADLLPIKGRISANRFYGDYTVYINRDSKVYHEKFLCCYAGDSAHLFRVIGSRRPCKLCVKNPDLLDIPMWYHDLTRKKQ